MVRGLACLLVTFAAAGADTQAQPPTHRPIPVLVPGERSARPEWRVSDEMPFWLELPQGARVWSADGLGVEPLNSAAVAVDNLRVGVLIGALRFLGSCVDDLRFRLQYVDEAWQPLGSPVENEARVGRVGPGQLVPYRFRLNTVDDLPTRPTGFVVVVDTLTAPHDGPLLWNRLRDRSVPAATPASCGPDDTRVESIATRRQTLRNGFRLEGRATVAGGKPVRADGMTITAVLHDAQGDILEVLVGTPTLDRRQRRHGLLAPGEQVAFTLQTDVPVGPFLAEVPLYVELLPHVDVAPVR